MDLTYLLLTHLNAIKRQQNHLLKTKQLLLNSLPTKSIFNTDLCEAVLAANIPLVSNSQFGDFLEKYEVKSIPFESTFREE